MSGFLISCIVPVFNGARYLRDALDSILAQTYRSIEVIVANDGSTDATPEVAESYGKRIRYLRQDNAGAPTARNLGVSMAQGEFIAFLDADDVWHPAKLKRELARFTERPELDLSVTQLQNFWIAELADEAVRLKHHRLAQPLPGYVTTTMLARRAVFEAVGPFAPDFRWGDDTDWFLRATECSVLMELLPEVLVYRRIHGHNISMERGGGRMTHQMYDTLLEVLKLSLERRQRREATAAVHAPPSGCGEQKAPAPDKAARTTTRPAPALPPAGKTASGR